MVSILQNLLSEAESLGILFQSVHTPHDVYQLEARSKFLKVLYENFLECHVGAAKTVFRQWRKQHVSLSTTGNLSYQTLITRKTSLVLDIYWAFAERDLFLSANFCSAQVIGARSKDPKIQRIVANHCHRQTKMPPPGRMNLMNSFSW